MQNVSTFLMFTGQAEEAMNFYCSIIPGSEIREIKKYDTSEPGREGTVMIATFYIGDQLFTCIDSPPSHQFTFTPSISIAITCSSEKETDEIFQKLSDGGSVMMPLGPYPFAKKYAWFTDKFGVSWQVSFPG